MMLGACASSPPLPPHLQVSLPAACERILQPVAQAPVSAGDDFRVLTAQGIAGLRTANSRIASARGCLDEQRARYGGSQK
jgi:hypothetical protein